MKRIWFALVLVLAACGTLLGQSVPPSAGELQYRLISPIYLGGGLHLTRTGTPQGVLVNPASAAGFQRVILDANYSHLRGLGGAADDADGTGNAVNFAMSIPTRAGVVSWGLGYQDTQDFTDTDMDFGMSGRLHLAYSKEIYSDTWFGFGIDGDFGELDGSLEVTKKDLGHTASNFEHSWGKLI